MEKETLMFFKPDRESDEAWIPLYSSGVTAGFPSPAEDYSERAIDLNREFVKDWACTFYVRASGDSMAGDCIYDGDLLLVDRSVEPFDHCIAVCYYNGGFTVKRVIFGKEEVTLMPSNEKYSPIVVSKEEDLIIWGVVRSLHRTILK